MLPSENPPQMAVDEALAAGRMDVSLGIRMQVVMPVLGSPPYDAIGARITKSVLVSIAFANLRFTWAFTTWLTERLSKFINKCFRWIGDTCFDSLDEEAPTTQDSSAGDRDNGCALLQRHYDHP